MKVFEYLDILIRELNESNSRNDKKEVLERHPECRRILNYMYDPFKKFNITSKNCQKMATKLAPPEKKTKMSRFTSKSKHEPLDISFFDFLDGLISGKYSGHKAISETLKWTKRYPEYEDIIYRIIDKDLKCRIGSKDINAVFEGLIPVFDIALADQYEKGKNSLLPDENWFISRKLDGVRCITVLNGDVKFYSRSGKEYKTLGKIKEILEPYKDMNIVLDGEICVLDETGLDDFRGVMSEITRKDHVMSNPTYLIFDYLSLEDFANLASEEILETRLKKAKKFAGDINIVSRIQYLEQVPYSKETFERMKEEVLEKDWEGLIVRKNCDYKGKRSRDILKVKEFFEEEFEVTEVNESTIQIINESGENVEVPGMGSATIMFKGNKVGVGSGWSQDQRIEFLQEPDKLIGKIITVKYKKESEDKDGNPSLQFPVMKAIHGDKREI